MKSWNQAVLTESTDHWRTNLGLARTETVDFYQNQRSFPEETMIIKWGPMVSNDGLRGFWSKPGVSDTITSMTTESLMGQSIDCSTTKLLTKLSDTCQFSSKTINRNPTIYSRWNCFATRTSSIVNFSGLPYRLFIGVGIIFSHDPLQKLIQRPFVGSVRLLRTFLLTEHVTWMRFLHQKHSVNLSGINFSSSPIKFGPFQTDFIFLGFPSSFLVSTDQHKSQISFWSPSLLYFARTRSSVPGTSASFNKCCWVADK